ncbi:NfeD family protein [Anaerotalea alkaliphila]|uniref:NfeD family protein n=1 Tax=Anaerotalea alkaliphila TaxID=2662126 RepID=A0A7X5KM77_9FIRM|nr:NfeD family protein [Anaerotalea alkaliphila]NDL67666.1 NfeD family protein [Anaerotalea alkaliphila]
MEPYVLWLVVIIATLLLEVATMSLTSIWFTVAGVVALLLSFTGLSFQWQAGVFIVLSALLLWLIYPLARKRLKPRITRTNYEADIGKTGHVIQTINNMEGKGQVKLQGQVWSAKAAPVPGPGGARETPVIHAGSTVVVVDIQGVKLIVEKMEGQETEKQDQTAKEN